MELGIDKLIYALKRQPKPVPVETVMSMLGSSDLPPDLKSELEYRQQQNPQIERERIAAELASIRANSGAAVDAVLLSTAAGHTPTASLRLGIHAARVSQDLVAQDPVFGTRETIREDVSRELGFLNTYDELTHSENDLETPSVPPGDIFLPRGREVPIYLPSYSAAD
jgi:hypothetical protein